MKTHPAFVDENRAIPFRDSVFDSGVLVNEEYVRKSSPAYNYYNIYRFDEPIPCRLARCRRPGCNAVIKMTVTASHDSDNLVQHLRGKHADDDIFKNGKLCQDMSRLEVVRVNGVEYEKLYQDGLETFGGKTVFMRRNPL